MGLKKEALPEKHLKALYCALDADDSNGLPFDEFLRFLKRYRPPKSLKAFGGKGGSSKSFSHTFDHALACTPTAQMRRELAERGVRLPGLPELTQLSEEFNEMLQRGTHRTSQNTLWTTATLACRSSCVFEPSCGQRTSARRRRTSPRRSGRALSLIHI